MEDGRYRHGQIAVLGAGAIGGSVAADLVRAGHDVLLVDQWPAHVEAIKAEGLRVASAAGEERYRVRALHVCELSALAPQLELVFLAPKSYDTRWMAELARPYLAPYAVVVGLQNGMNDEEIAAIVGWGRVLGCAFELSAELFTPGRVQRNTARERAWFGLGELHGRITPRLREIGAVLEAAGRVALTANIHGAKWAKLVTSAMILAPFGMLGMQSWEAIEVPEVFRLCIRLGREALAVGAALGYAVEPIYGLGADAFLGSSDETAEKLLRTIVEHHGEQARKVRGVVLQDYLKGRETETEFLTGLVVRKGREANVPTPANEAVAEINRRIRRGQLRPQRSNLALVEALLRK